MKKSLIFLAMMAAVSQARVVDWVVATVENQPITNAEVQAVASQGRMSQQQALNYLIDQKLFNAKVKESGATATPGEVDNAVAQILKNNNFTLEQFKQILAKQGTTYEKFRQELASDIVKQKLLGNTMQKFDPSKVTEAKARQWYEANKKMFATGYNTFHITRFFAESPNDFATMMSGMQSPNVVSTDVTVRAGQIDPRMAQAFASMPNGSFTPVIQSQEGYYEIIRMNSKSGSGYRSFESVKGEIMNMLIAQEEQKVAQSYFTGLRSNATVKLMKQPGAK